MIGKLSLLILLAAGFQARGAVVINELFAAPSDRQLSFSNGVPRLGSGVPWMDPDFNDWNWNTGNLPAGYGFAGLGTDLSTAMRDKTPSLYLRKEFTLTPAQASFVDPLVLAVEYNDGFVAYLNGREVARANCGAVNRFMYARQPAFNVSTSALFVDFNLGPAHAFLRPGRNVLAIQAHNAEQPSTPSNPSLITQHLPTPEFKINAALRISTATIVSFRPAALDFNDAAGGLRIHANTNGVTSDVASGALASGGWLATAPNPTSSAAWQGLRIETIELPEAGVEASGALRFNVSQSGPNQPAALYAPPVSLAGGWEPGSVSTEYLNNTVLRFRCRSSGTTQFRLRFDPALGQEASALGGFPVVSATNEAPITFASAANGARVMTVNSAGGQAQSQLGSLSSLSLFAFASNDVRSMSFRIVEDATIGAGNNGSKGHLRTEITQAAAAGSYWGFSYGGIQVPVWNPGNVSSQDLAYAGFQFACKLPAGVSFRVWAEPGSGGYSNRVDWGTITGDGAWQIVVREFAGAAGAENFRTALNAASTRNFKLLFQGSATLGAGSWLQVDDFQVTPWRKYEIRLADGTNGRPAFLNYLNAFQSVSFIPAFEKLSDASTAQSFTIDDYEILFAATNASSVTNLVNSGGGGGPWKYFVGLAEPSGGVFDPGLLSTTFQPPAGEEDDFETPSEFVDWIELANNGAAPVDLAGWSLSDERDTPAKWRFPANTVLPPGAHLLVLCDDREEANPPAGPALFLHASFSLSSDGEYVGLYDGAGTVIDALARYPRQTHFASYGRNPSNPQHFGFLGTATPGTNNAGIYYVSRAEPPEFKQANSTNDLPGGIYNLPSLSLRLTNSTPAPGTIMRYTLDGSEPTDSNGLTYTGPVTLTQSTEKTGIVVRARTFLPNWLASGVKTYTYLLRQPAALTNVPAMIFTAQKERVFYKPSGLLAIQGGIYQSASGGGEVWLANGPQSYNEALGNGPPFEREVHMEYYFPAGYYQTNQSPLREDIGLRVSSSPYQRARLKFAGVEANSPWVPAWDPNEKPSFNIFFNGDYGLSKLDYRIFENYDVKEFQHLRLRAGKNDHSNPFITDELVRRLWIDMGHVGSRGLFCSLYLNGVYKGVYNLTERIREPLFQAHHRSSLDWDVRYNYDWVNGDGIAYNAMMTALNRNMAQLGNYLAAAELINVDNFADYYLLNIYCAMWDWPENNFVFARERSTNALSRFTYAVWDAEGAFNINGYYSKPVSFNTVTELGTKNADVANVWRRLVLSPEFRLRFADRVHRHMFNGGVLDDRDPDGTGPEKPVFWRHFDALAAQAAPLVLYNSGAPLSTNLFTSWTSATGGRRTYLLGNTAGRQILRDAGLWPVTEPPVFDQHGGPVPNGYSLTITSAVAVSGQSATIYVTLDGADPRLAGGNIAGTAILYSGPIAITNIVTVKARARNDTTGEWSPLTEAAFAPSAVPATSNNLVVAEIMYHPPELRADELATGFSDPDDFEFARLQNIGGQVLDLGGVRFVAGITFDFNLGSVRFLNPGANVLVVKNRSAFRTRYGDSLDSRIAGEYAGNLGNSGERLLLVSGESPVRDFFYGDAAPWPNSPDGHGASLLLRAPASSPDHSLPSNWIACAIPGGIPSGTIQTMTFDKWSQFAFGAAATNGATGGPSADADGDGIANFAEYLLGLMPTIDQSELHPQAAIEAVGGVNYLTVQFTLSPVATGVTTSFDYSSNLTDWFAGSQPVPVSSTFTIDGTTVHKVRDTAPVTGGSTRFLRLRLAQ